MKDRYAWQEKCMECWEKNGFHGIVKAVTGSGKTILAIKAIRILLESNADLKVYVVVPTKALMNQWYRILTRHFERRNVRRFNSNSNIVSEKDGVNIMIYVINSARYNLARRILGDMKNGDKVFLIADECQHYTSMENRKIFEFLQHQNFCASGSEWWGSFFSMGLSATLVGEGVKDILTPALGRIIYHYSLEEARRNQTVSEFSVLSIAMRFNVDERTSYLEISDNLAVLHRTLLKRYPILRCSGTDFFQQLRDMARVRQNSRKAESDAATLARYYLSLTYKRRRLVAMAENRVRCVCNLISHTDMKKRCIVFSESIEQSEKLYHEMRKIYPGKTGCIHSKMGWQANKNTMERLENGEIRILITCKSLDEGIDIPDMDVGIILSGTSSERQRLQRLGRIIRHCKGKQQACLYYLHIVDTMEEKSYISGMNEMYLMADMEYFAETDEIKYPAYDKCADKYLDFLVLNKANANVLREARACISRGRYTGDWLLGREKCLEYAEKEADIHESNYWYCMAALESTGKILEFE